MEKSPSFTVTDESIPYLEVDPPHWAARGLPYILILLFLTFLISSIVIQIPETISVPFVLVPVHGADPVRAPETGIVREVNVMEAQTVTKGQPLFLIHSQNTGDRAADLRSLQMEIKGSEEKLSTARAKYDSQRMSDGEEDKRLKGRISYLDRMIEMKNKELNVTKELLLSYEKLYKEGIMNRTDFANHQLETDKIQLDLEEMQTERNEASSNLEKLHHESSGRAAEFQALEHSIKEDRDKSTFHSEALTKELINSHLDELSVPAPCDGTVLDLRAQAPGAVVQGGDTLCELACSGQNLQAELKVPEQGMARMKEGQGVKLLYDAFPYQRFGVRFGVVRWISPAAMSGETAGGFRVLVDPKDSFVYVKGIRRPLMPGMAGSAEIVLERRSLISYAFAPIRQLQESLSSPPDEGNKK